ncbi:hypothetical protein QVD17_06842 [Tagetes erecta]|uniref:Uncharacterized protein n=1 Tax=Tagetes erecta TaxID=13708 RepID=A0AAD8LL05_TARER|nr:hypothetical protein QVD17_06842 [Tagetes erecta]
MANVQNVQNVQTGADQRGIDGSKYGADGSVAMMKTDDIAATSAKGNSNDMVTNLNGSGVLDDIGKRSYAEQVLENGKNSSHAGGEVPLAFVKHFERFLGDEDNVTLPIPPDLFLRRLEDDIAVNMIRPVSETEIKKAMLSIGAGW